MLNVFSGLRRETIVGILQISSIAFLILSVMFPLIILVVPPPAPPSLEAMIGVATMFLFCVFASASLFGISFLIEDMHVLARTAAESTSEEETASPQFASRVKAIEARAREEVRESPARSNGEDEEKYLISMPKPASAAPPAGPPTAAPTGEARKCFESVKTYVDLEMWPLAYQKAQDLLAKYPNSAEAAKVKKSFDHIRQMAEDIEIPGKR